MNSKFYQNVSVQEVFPSLTKSCSSSSELCELTVEMVLGQSTLFAAAPNRFRPVITASKEIGWEIQSQLSSGTPCFVLR